MNREALPGVFDTIEVITLALVGGGLLGIVGFIFITFFYSEKRGWKLIQLSFIILDIVGIST